MLKILEPLKVGAGNTTTVGKQVGNANNATFLEDFFGGKSSRAIGTFKDSLALN